MDDRFRNEGTDFTPDSYYPEKSRTLGDFSENIDSNGAVHGAPSAPKPKKFEVHIADFDDIPAEKPASVNKAAPQKSAPARQVNKTHAGRSVQGQKKPASSSGKNGAVRKTAATTGQTRRASGTSKSTTGRKPAPAKKTSQASQRKKNRRKYNFVKGLLITCVCLIFISIITVTVSTVALSVINDILVIDADDNSSVLIEIPEGADYDTVFNILVEEGLVKQKFLTDIFCRFRHYDKIDVYKDGVFVETKKIQYEPGNYYLDADAGVENMLETIMVRNNYAKDTIRLTFPEGWSIAKVFEKIEKYDVCEADKLYANLEIIGNQYGFISDIQNVSGRYLKAEGYLFPDTYDFYIGENASSVLKKLFNNFESRWTAEYDTRLKELGMTKDQIINIAAIIQREAKDGTQMGVISSVIHNRLQDSATYPNLEMNSTRDYISSLKDYNLFSDVYYSLYLEKYNTYSQPGLPPGPICNPGKTAIEAALYPSDTDYYFFCHNTSTGEIYLAETADEHLVNTSKVLYGNIEG